ncbi:coenzyme F420-0:L-glutamate ligase [Candidatus Saccharibacteria bacterium]|nr:coenzyme F420-0:L-glutamate ligase [Candidatus Saccharibacteria bacterium]MCL1963016.1 coenzyme F420-0:L-glutamate ligase [Candidatus Saccharibacteria bacterium]
MLVKAIKTCLVRANEISLHDLLAESIKTLSENSVVAISSKIVSLCENAVVPIGAVDKEDLIKAEADFYLDNSLSPYSYHFTIKYGTLVAAAGVDESNGDGNYVLWPRDPFATASSARMFLCEKFGRKNIGVIITDSVSSPLRRGTKGEMIAWSGFEATHDYVGSSDLFGRDFKCEMAGVSVSLAIAANIAMGEGAERTPLAVISDIDFVRFVDRDPTRAEINVAFVSKEDDLFMPFLNALPWRKGGGGYKSQC